MAAHKALTDFCVRYREELNGQPTSLFLVVDFSERVWRRHLRTALQAIQDGYKKFLEVSVRYSRVMRQVYDNKCFTASFDSTIKRYVRDRQTASDVWNSGIDNSRTPTNVMASKYQKGVIALVRLRRSSKIRLHNWRLLQIPMISCAWIFLMHTKLSEICSWHRYRQILNLKHMKKERISWKKK